MKHEATLGELVRFVLEHRRGNAFKAYSEEAIASGIKNASDNGTMLYCCRTDGTVCGIIVCFNDVHNKVMYVHDLLTTEKWCLAKFVRHFVHTYPFYKLCAQRRQKPVHYINTTKLCDKLMKGNI